MYKIAIVTSDIERDWASSQLLDAANQLAEGTVVDPRGFAVHANGSGSLQIHDAPADAFDAFIMRGFNRNGDVDFQFEMLQLLEGRGHLVVNSPAALSLSESKSQTTFCLHEAGIPVPRTMVAQSLDQIHTAVKSFGTAVLKAPYGSHGVDIEKVTKATEKELGKAFLRKYRVVYVQEYIPNVGRDIRAFVVGDDIPAAIYRNALPGQWKTNVAQGGITEPCELTPAMREICMESAKIAGLDYTGVDIVEGPDGPVVLEVNGAPWWYGLAEATHRNVALDIVGHTLRMLELGQAARQPTGFRLRGRTRSVH